MRRGGGGLVTALSGLVSHRKALWIASAMTDEDIAVADEAGGEPVEIELDGVDYDVCMVASDPTAYDRFYNVIANPILWFIQHYLWDLSNAPDIRQDRDRGLGRRLQGRQRRHRPRRSCARSRARRSRW